MRLLLITALTFAATSAAAHPTHIGEGAGHNHWVAVASITLAGVAVWLARVKEKRDQAKATKAKSA